MTSQVTGPGLTRPRISGSSFGVILGQRPDSFGPNNLNDDRAEAKRIVPDGVSAVFDGVGKDTFVRSFDCTAPYRYLINYGNASGQVPPINLLDLSVRGSLSVCRVGIGRHLGDPVRFREAMDKSFDLVARGVLRTSTIRTYPLAEAAAAHRAVESAAHSGPIVLLP